MADVVVIGGGIAGVSAAAYLAQSMDVILLEAEPVLAYHTTGRSAALYYPGYGHSSVGPLSEVSGDFFRNPEFTDHALLSPRGVLTVEVGEQRANVPVGTARRLNRSELRQLLPAFGESVHGGVWEPDPMDVDVAATHQAFVRMFWAAGGVIHRLSRVRALRRDGELWRVDHGDTYTEAPVVVNAAGAWADQIAGLAGIAPVGLIPKRRTAFMIVAPPQSQEWPLTHDVDSSFYFKPDGEQLMCSLADETPSDPCDAQPRELDVSLAIERINLVTTFGIRSVQSQWAGLRTFAPDGGMVIGAAPEADGFYWLAGQGGTGIQTAPAAGQLTASLVKGEGVPDDLVKAGFDLSQMSSDRFT